MTKRLRLGRTVQLILGLAFVLGASSMAQAVITGTVQNPAGVPLDDITLRLNDGAGAFSDSDQSTGSGTFTLTPGIGDTGPFSIVATDFDGCRDFNDPLRNATTTVGSLTDPQAGLVVTIDVRDFCAGQTPFGAPDSTGLVDGATRSILVPVGGLVYVEVHLLSSAGDPRIQLPDGTRLSPPRASSSNDLQLNAPATAYNGPVNLAFESGGATVTRNMGNLNAFAALSVPKVGAVPFDIEAIVDVSGSMGGTDPKFLRKDALNLLADLSGTADGLGAVGFDSAFQPIADLRQTTTQTIVNQFKSRVRTQVVNRGGTDYNIGMDKAFEAMNAPGIDPTKPKLVLFLTDGANGSTYNNGHLRFANPGLFNGGKTTRPWPVCAVQLGNPSSFQPVDVARLKRIASETGGKYFAIQSSARLNDIYFQCRGQNTGQQTLLSKAAVFTKANQQKAFRRALPRNRKQATFFVSSGGTFTFVLTLRDPNGKLITAARRPRGVIFRKSGTFAFFRVTRPKAGPWTVVVRSKRLIDPRGQGRVTISVPTK